MLAPSRGCGIVIPPSERLAQVRETVIALRDLGCPSLHTLVAMAVRGPTARRWWPEVADTGTCALMPNECRVEVARLAREFRAISDVELEMKEAFERICASYVHWGDPASVTVRTSRCSGASASLSAIPTNALKRSADIYRVRGSLNVLPRVLAGYGA